MMPWYFGMDAQRRGQTVMLVYRVQTARARGPVARGVLGSGSGRTNVWGFMVIGGSYLFCAFISIFLSQVPVFHVVLRPFPKPVCAPV